MEDVWKSRIFAVMIGMLFIIVDQWIKVQALWMLQSESFRFGGSMTWLDVALSLNGGAFLSMGAGLAAGAKQLIFVVGVGIAVCWAFWWSLSRWSASPRRVIAVYAIALGGASNLIDRVFRDGHVVDYLILNLGTLHTGVFNLADIAIMAGAGALMVAELRKRG
ncbi:signal peptidase II [Pseudomonas putida]